MSDKRVFLTKHSPEYWRVTLNHPPLNIFGPKTIPQLNEIITAIETDKDLKVVVFDSAIDGFFMTHYDFLAKIEETTSLPPGPTGLQPLPDMLVRLSRASAVFDCVNPRTRHWRRKRTRFGLRHAFRQPRKGDPVAL